MSEYDDVARVRDAQEYLRQTRESRGGVRSGVDAGTHAYGYVDEPGECVRCGYDPTTTKCHDRYYCVGCLQLHGNEVRADGLTVEYVGKLDVVPDSGDASADYDMTDTVKGEDGS